ncbi:hypothetical protein ACFSJU_09945 [Paradesertivirga mongoliensis]|uniref:Uncharacterized protein n=1 Tax=Paradesertivirga mongoliensis TaxID=2100740 RepID=A0ABW4ZMI8_9SPHI|nr:hypothetical protein [Pedobacter mongoliensis]
MITTYRLLTTAGLFLTLSKGAFSQALNDSSYIAAASQNLTNFYLSQQRESSSIFNGRYYFDHISLHDNEHTFFGNGQFVQGSITSEGYSYNDLDVAYDIVRDELIVIGPDKKSKVIVNPKFVESFFVQGHTFINLKTDTESEEQIPSGYYDLLHKGPSVLLAKRQKKVHESVNQFDVKRNASVNDRYYLLRDSVFRQVKTKGDLVNLFGTNRSQIQQYIKTNKLNFKKEKERSILRVVGYFDSIKN